MVPTYVSKCTRQYIYRKIRQSTHENWPDVVRCLKWLSNSLFTKFIYSPSEPNFELTQSTRANTHSAQTQLNILDILQAKLLCVVVLVVTPTTTTTTEKKIYLLFKAHLNKMLKIYGTNAQILKLCSILRSVRWVPMSIWTTRTTTTTTTTITTAESE